MKKRILSILLVLCMTFTLIPSSAFAAETGSANENAADMGTESEIVNAAGGTNEPNAGDFYVSGGVSGTDYSYADHILTIKSGTAMTISGTTTMDTIVVDSGVTANITLSGVDIQLSGDYIYEALTAFTVRNSNVNLTLTGVNILKSGTTYAGLYVPEGAVLTITDASTGCLEASGGASGAGIGGAFGNYGIINIQGGTITATGGYRAAGIGAGGDRLASGTVNITGGSVYAVGSTETGAQNIGHGFEGTNEGTLQGINGVDLNRTVTTVGLEGVTGAGVSVTDLTVTYNGTNYPYSTAGMTTMADGKLYLWLPTGATVSEVIADNKDYTGTVISGNTGTLNDTGSIIASVTTSEGKTTKYVDFNTALSTAMGSSDGTLKLLGDVSSTSEINILNKMTLDLNGYTLDMGNNSLRVHYYNSNYGELTINDSSAARSGVITSRNHTLRSSGKLIINGGTVKTTEPNYYALWCESNADVFINGGTFIGTRVDVAFSSGAKALVINAGSFTGKGLQTGAVGVILKGGTFSHIQAASGTTVDSLLADNYCYYQGNTAEGTVASGSGQIMSDTVTVGEIDWSKAVTYDDISKTYTVSSAEGLRWISDVSNQTIEADTYKNDPVLPIEADFSGCTIKLNADIDLSGKNWTPISAMSGIFDGAGHEVKNMTVIENGSGGFITYLNSGATVKNLSIIGSVTVNNDSYDDEPNVSHAGGIAADVFATQNTKTSIENCVVNVAVTVNGIVYTVSLGGIVGSMDATCGNSTVSLKNCYSGGTVTNNATVYQYTHEPYMGALVGEFFLFTGNTGVLTNCYVSQSGINMVGHNYDKDIAALLPVLTSLGIYDANGTLTATDGTSLLYGSELKTAMKSGVLRQYAGAVNYVTWTADAIPTLTTTYATAHTHQLGQWTKQADGSYTNICTECGETITAEVCVTSDIVETPYGTLEEAITAAQSENGSTVKLLADVATEQTVKVSSGSFTIDLNGKTWSSTVTGMDSFGLWLAGDSQVTLKDSVGTGTFTGEGSSTIFSQFVSVTIESGTYSNTGNGEPLNAFVVNQPDHRIIINGGTFKSSTSLYTRTTFDNSNATITGGSFENSGILFVNCKDIDITGGSFTNIETYANEAECIGTVGGLLGDGYAYSKKSDNTWISDVSGMILADVTAKAAPVKITTQPVNTTVTYGYKDALVLSVTTQKAEGVASDVAYQWYLNNGSTAVATGADCTVESGLGAGTYSYICKVTCDGYTVSSSTATVTVNQATGSITNKDYPTSFIYSDQYITNPTATNFTSNVPEENFVYTWYSGDKVDDGKKMSGLPKEVGIYTLKVTAQGNANVTAAEYTMKVEIKYLETDAVPKPWMKENYTDKVWYNKSDFEGYVYLNTAGTGYVIRLDADAYWYDDMYINDKIKDSDGKIKEGQVEVKYQLRDMNTHQITDFKSYFFNIDVTAPTIDKSNIKYSQHQSFLDWLFHNSSIQVTVPVSDAISGADHIGYVLTPDGGTAQAEQIASVGTDGNATFTVEKNFKGTITVTAYDKAGNPSEPVTVNKMSIEDTKPTVNVNDGANAFVNQWYTTEQTLHISALDAGSGIKSVTYTIDGGNASTLFEAKESDGSLTATKDGLTISANEGEHTYAVTVTDHALNTITQTVTIKQDIVLPEVTDITVQSEATITDTTATVTFTASESGSFYYYTVKKGGPVPDATKVFGGEAQVMTAGDQNTISLTELDPDQDYTLYLAAKDMAGNKTAQVIPFDFKTDKISLAAAEVTLADSNFAYTGVSQMPAVTVSMGGVPLPAPMYVINYSNSNGGDGNTSNVGTITVTVTASESGPFTGTADSKPTYTIKKATINPHEVGFTCYSGTYDGAAHNAVLPISGIPEGAVVTYSKSTDHGVTWSDYASNCPQIANAGSMLVKIKVTKDNYEDLEIAPKTATIAKKSVTVTASDCTRTYREKNPTFSLKPLTEGLLVGTDTIYDLKVTLSTGATETSDVGTYEITGSSLSNNYDVTIAKGTLTIRKAAVAPGMPASSLRTTFSYAKVSDVTLPAGWVWKDTDKDKALTVEVPVSVSAVYNGNDKGSYEKETVQIVITRSANNMESYSVAGLQSSYSYTGSEIRPTISLFNGGSQVASDYYKVSYQNNTNAGTATIIITGINGYTGTITKTFIITKIDATLTVPKTKITKAYGKNTFTLNAKTAGTAAISYKSNNKSVAKVNSSGKVTIVGYGIVTFTITTQGPNLIPETKKVMITVKPKTMVKPKVKSSDDKKIKIAWKKDRLATGYQIRYSTGKKFTSKTTKSTTIKSNKTLSKKISKLKSGKNYYVQVRAYKKSGKSKIYSSWSSASRVKVK